MVLRILASVSFVLFLAIASPTAFGQDLGSLKTVTIPQVPGLERYVRDRDALVVLGKALFWDMQIGSDSQTACATCHFHAGADHRVQNQLSNPKGAFLANSTQSLGDFPFHLLADASDNRSTVMRDSGQRAGSAGVFRRMFSDVAANGGSDDGFDVSDTPAFTFAGLNVRQVTLRNTPTVINAVFNVRNLWDGRASDIFTGLTPFGESDVRPNALAVVNGQLVPEKIRIENSSLASQAVGPALNAVEMSYDGRTWQKLGKRMLALQPLALQKVAVDDSVLGPLANPDGRGLRAEHTYLALVQRAFQPQYWDSTELVDTAGNRLVKNAPAESTSEFTPAEFNFPLFFGLAIQAYEATLVSDDTRFDRFSEGNASALTAQEQTGLRVFRNNECADCHVGPEFTLASFSSISRRGRVQRSRNGLTADTGFFRTGVRPIIEDNGLGDSDDFGKPFSQAVAQGGPLGINGAFKTSALRNVEFTGPYFHNGGQATLEQVIDFYNRGSDFPDGGNLSPDIRRLNMSAVDRAALVAFLKSLSDDRVRFERAPFDHPELCVPVGQMDAPGDERFPLSAADRFAGIPAVGRGGNAVPLQTFDELLQRVGADGSRAHPLTDQCSISLTAPAPSASPSSQTGAGRLRVR